MAEVGERTYDKLHLTNRKKIVKLTYHFEYHVYFEIVLLFVRAAK